MTTTITTNRNSVTDFTAYLYSFNEDFTPRDKAFYETTRAGEFYGVIAGSAANIGDTVRPNAMGYLMGDAVGSIGTLQTISRVAFGDGVYSTRNDLKMSIPSYTVEFSPEIGGAIAGFMRLIVERRSTDRRAPIRCPVARAMTRSKVATAGTRFPAARTMT